MGMFYGHNQTVNNAPDVYFYNWWAISNANFAPAGWSMFARVNSTAIGNYCNYYGVDNLNAKVKSSYRGASGGIGSFSNSWLTWLNNYYLVYGSYGFYFDKGGFYARETQDYVDKHMGYGVILIKNDSTDPGTLTDYDGNVYNTIKIGTSVFTVESWRCKHLNEGTLIPYKTIDSEWGALTDMGMCGYDTNSNIFC